ncbi:hypothetical protein Cob_v003342 [Colletotrichum orbiculare MAFF 240422]|uniref:Glycosyl transferase family 8 protein n=1 Tax=Colletotrichum orbiculare (strain 104-T / ATCC 96160 / CBS 514.97 / LARS 414 / MAFF 240422) TaxID=1213857 RepID=N4VGF1_COLOR|nr:hypothetical protein Cob_v003342 [Colletotrichum orbiculare MAFF 240422]
MASRLIFRLIPLVIALGLVSLFFSSDISKAARGASFKAPSEHPPPKPKYKPQPTWSPPLVKDPFPMLMSSAPPPIPPWNKPKAPNVYSNYNLPVAPPLLIGFTRSWPLLLQTVVGYVTAGWPANQIYVIENTGVHESNAKGRLSLQNPLYLNHTQLQLVGVNVIRTPVLMNFAQLQNFFVSLSKEKKWPYYFWSHMDSLVLSLEEGVDGVSGPVNAPDYQTIYDLAVRELNHTLHTDERWGARFFAYDHLALVNPEAYEEVGGFDTFIPYYMTDCDMHWRLEEAGYSMNDAKAGIIQDVASVLDDLRILYREQEVPDDFGFTDPNPPPTKVLGSPRKEDEDKNSTRGLPEAGPAHLPKTGDGAGDIASRVVDPLPSFKRLHRISMDMFNHKHADRERNTWQMGQKGGDTTEPYYYDASGFQRGIDIMTEAGRKVFSEKWGHRDCDFGAAGLHPSDAWRVEKDWE